MGSSSAFGRDPDAVRRWRRFVQMSFARRSVVRAIVAALFILGVAAPAAAAGLGGLTSGGPGADASVVGSCDSDGVHIEYQTGSSASGRPMVTGAVISALHPSCAGSTLQVTISDAGGSQLATGTARVIGSAQAVTWATPVHATTITGAAVLITG